MCWWTDLQGNACVAKARGFKMMPYGSFTFLSIEATIKTDYLIPGMDIHI